MKRQHVDIISLIQWYEPFSPVLVAEAARVRTTEAVLNCIELQV